MLYRVNGFWIYVVVNWINYLKKVMSSDFCDGHFCSNLDDFIQPPPIPPAEFLPRHECREILSGCNVLTSLKGALENYSDPCLIPAAPSTASSSTSGLTTTTSTSSVASVASTYKLVTDVVLEYTSPTENPILNVTKSSQSLLYGEFPAWAIGVSVLAVLALIIIIIVIVICVIKAKKGESQERRADFVLSDYHRVNYLHNKLEKGQKFKNKRKKKDDANDANSSNNNIEDDNHCISQSQKSSANGSCQAESSSAGYDKLSKCYSRQSKGASYFSENESRGSLVEDRESGLFTFQSNVDIYPPESTTSSQRDERIYTPTILDGEADDMFFPTSFRGSGKGSPYAVSDFLPNVPQNDIDDDIPDDMPPPAPHGMYANRQFEKLGGFRNRSYIDDEDHKGKPLPPNPFPDLKSHTSLIGSSLYDNAGDFEETGLYKKNKKVKPVPKKRQKIKQNDEDSDDTITV